MQSVAPPPALPLLFLLNQWVCLQWKEEEEEGEEDEEEEGEYVMWSGDLLVQEIKWGKDNASVDVFIFIFPF